MKVNIDLNKTIAENEISDELHSDVGSSPFFLEHDFFFGSTDFEVWTGISKTGTKLTENTDYTLSGVSPDLTQRAVSTVYSTVTITNATYQSGNLYFYYHACADYIEVDDRYLTTREKGSYQHFLPDGAIVIHTDKQYIQLEATGTGTVTLNSENESVYTVNNGNLILGTVTTGDVLLSSTDNILFNDQYQSISMYFSESGADGLGSKFLYDRQSLFNWTVRSINDPSSLLGAVVSNRDDLYEYVELVATQGANIGVAAGANLIGCDGIPNATPTGKSKGDDSNLQEMLEGIGNTKLAGSGTFNDAAYTANTITHNYGNTSYSVAITPTVATNGYLGEYWVINKTATTFDIVKTGTGTSLTFDWVIIGI